jgi:DeoR family fructose operon transcriptional repressor
MASSSIVNGRRIRILDILNERRSARVEELSADLAVSPVTVRRDLDYLYRKGFLVRRHGGALPVNLGVDAVPEKKLEEKDDINIEEKTRIAERATQLVRDGDTLFMNSGSTILAFISAIRNKRIKVITNNAAAIMAGHDPGIELLMLGGEYREQSRSLVGEFALNTIRNIYSGYTFLGTNGISLERGLTTSVYQECSINQAMIANTHEKVIVLADFSKMDKVSNFVSSPLSSIDIVITDDKCPEQFRKGLTDLGIEVIIA